MRELDQQRHVLRALVELEVADQGPLGVAAVEPELVLVDLLPARALRERPGRLEVVE